MVSWKAEKICVKRHLADFEKNSAFTFFSIRILQNPYIFLENVCPHSLWREDWRGLLFLEHINIFLLVSFESKESHLRNHETEDFRCQPINYTVVSSSRNCKYLLK